jgi:pyrimidine-nucleoside phosphorylase
LKIIPAEIIKAKRNKQALTEEEIQEFILGYTRGEIPDYQMSALLMAIYFNGMSQEETLSLTKTMLHSGIVVDFSKIPQFKVDKHSTGGVGDKTSLILGPIIAACGVAVPMISGRGLGHTGGTLDKLESIPGFNTQLSLEQFQKAVSEKLICFIGQTKDICPADKKIYALRDVTATVESLPLICASIMSKKLAEGIDGLVLDVKYGSGAFMKTKEDCERLARALMGIARGYGKKVTAVLSTMNQPLGAFAGNALEVRECVDILQNKIPKGPHQERFYQETRELSLVLSAEMLLQSGKYKDIQSARVAADEALTSGAAYHKFLELCQIHSGRLNELPEAKSFIDLKSPESGFINFINTEKIGIAGILLKAGRAKTSDVIEPTSGFEFFAKIGDRLEKGQPILRIYGNDPQLFPEAEKLALSAYQFSTKPVPCEQLIWKIIHP